MSTQVPREKAVFCEAVEITDPEQRRRFLDAACGADKTLRERVEALLAMSQNAGDFFNECRPALEAKVGDAAQVLSAAESALAADPLEARCIGPYKLLQMLGEGGYGVVYMAEQEQPIRRRVAVKIIKLGMDTKNVIARFEAERQALALMDHPNIARVLDAGATETGRPYFVMELVYGVKITDYCDQNRVGMQERLELFVQVCNAVQHAHQKGIIHRDLKPSNIMVTMHDGVPVPKVIDFGIAKATEQRLTDKTLFTSYAQLMGTPAYMSPEQMELSGLNLDTRSDIYSLGVLLYELLTGRTPFDTSELLKSGVDELRRTLREQEPLSPSAKLKTLANDELTKTAKLRRVEPLRFVSQLHGDLDWIVLKCLEKDRTRRYETANALALDIENYLRDDPVLARPPSKLYRLHKLVRRNRMVFVFGAAAVAALLGGTVISTLMFVKEREAWRSEARLRREAEVREEASHVASLVTQGHFAEADKLSASLPLDKPSVEVSAELRALGDWHAANGRWAEAALRFESVIKVNQLDDRDLISEEKLKLAAALLESGNLQGYEQLRQNEVAGLIPSDIASDYRTLKLGLLLPPDPKLQQTLVFGGELAEKKFPTAQEIHVEPPHVLQWCEALALLEYRRGHPNEASDWCYRCEKYGLHKGAQLATVSLIRAMCFWRQFDYEEAMADWAQGCELIQAKSQQGLDIGGTAPKLFPGTPQDLEGDWYDWAIADLLKRECDELFAQSDQILESRSKSDLSSKNIVASFPSTLGEWHAIRNEWERARYCFEYVQQFELDDGHAARNYYEEALAELKLGDQTSFIRLRDVALNRFKGTTNEDAAQHIMKLALLSPTSDSSTAELQPTVQFLERAEANAEARAGQSGSEANYAAWDLMLLGLSEYRHGNYAKASNLCRHSLDFCTYLSIPAIQDRIILAMCYHELGNDARARVELDGATSLAESDLNTGVDSWNWREWVFVRLLLQEANGLIPQARASE
jgi:serine/threonine protein kinase